MMTARSAAVGENLITVLYGVSWVLADINPGESLTGADPNHLSFVRVQLEAVPAHPQINFFVTADKTFQVRSRRHLHSTGTLR